MKLLFEYLDVVIFIGVMLCENEIGKEIQNI